MDSVNQKRKRKITVENLCGFTHNVTIQTLCSLNNISTCEEEVEGVQTLCTSMQIILG